MGWETDDLHEVALAQLAGHGSEDARASGVVGLREQDGGVLVEADERTVGAAIFLVNPHHHGLDDLALLDLAARLRGLDGGGDDVAHRRVLAVVTAGHADDKDLLGTRVVRDLEPRFLLNHYFAFSTISNTRQRFSFEIGRVSVIRTRSPTPHSFFSSWTLKRVRCCTVLRYSRWAFDVPTWTITVLFILSEITVPRRTLRWPRSWVWVVAIKRAPRSWLCGCASAWAPRRVLRLPTPNPRPVPLPPQAWVPAPAPVSPNPAPLPPTPSLFRRC